MLILTIKLLNIKSATTVFVLSLSFLYRTKKKKDIATHKKKKFGGKKFFRR